MAMIFLPSSKDISAMLTW